MPINQSLLQFQLLFGTFDISPYLLSFAVSVPASEINTPLVWTANFEVALTDAAYRNGLTENTFSEVTNPSIWREAQAQVKLIITKNGVNYPFPIMRVKNYRYDYKAQVGRGELTQILELMQFDRQAALIPDTEFGAATPLNTVVKNLLTAAGNINGDQIINPANIFISGLLGALDVKLASKDPVQDAQKYTGINWKWLYTDHEEKIRLIDRPETATPLFVRSKSQIDFEPKLDNIAFVANKVRVSGSYQKSSLPDLTDAVNPDNSVDSKGRPRMVRTETVAPVGEIFPDEKPGDTTQITSDVKSIFYRYKDNLSTAFNPNLYVNLTDEVINAVSDYPRFIGSVETDIIQTITVTETIVGKVFKSDKPDPANTPAIAPTQPSTPPITSNAVTSVTYGDVSPAAATISPRLLGYIVSSIDIETERGKYNFVPFGVKFSDEDVSFARRIALTLNQYEKVRTPAIIQGIASNIIDPETGKALRFEIAPELEATNPAPTFNFTTVPVTAEFELTPSTYNTFLPKVNPINIDFLPSQFFADLLARKFAIREMGRREADEYIMELPIEWMASGFQHFAVADLFNRKVLVENPQISMNNKRLLFSFIGEKIADIPVVVEPNNQLPYIPVDSLHIAPSAGIVGYVGTMITPTQLSAFGGAPPYTFSGTLPTGLTLTTAGFLSGMPTVSN
jgi:hypothetical protein